MEIKSTATWEGDCFIHNVLFLFFLLVCLLILLLGPKMQGVEALQLCFHGGVPKCSRGMCKLTYDAHLISSYNLRLLLKICDETKISNLIFLCPSNLRAELDIAVNFLAYQECVG